MSLSYGHNIQCLQKSLFITNKRLHYTSYKNEQCIVVSDQSAWFNPVSFQHMKKTGSSPSACSRLSGCYSNPPTNNSPYLLLPETERKLTGCFPKWRSISKRINCYLKHHLGNENFEYTRHLRLQYYTNI